MQNKYIINNLLNNKLRLFFINICFLWGIHLQAQSYVPTVDNPHSVTERFASNLITSLYVFIGTNEYVNCATCECIRGYETPAGCSDLVALTAKYDNIFFKLIALDILLVNQHRYRRYLLLPKSGVDSTIDELIKNYVVYKSKFVPLFEYSKKFIKNYGTAPLDSYTFSIRYSQFIQNYSFLVLITQDERYSSFIFFDPKYSETDSLKLKYVTDLLNEINLQISWLLNNLNMAQYDINNERSPHLELYELNNLSNDLIARKHLLSNVLKNIQLTSNAKDSAKIYQIVIDSLAKKTKFNSFNSELKDISYVKRGSGNVKYDIVKTKGGKVGLLYRNTHIWAIPPIYKVLSDELNDEVYLALSENNEFYNLDIENNLKSPMILIKSLDNSKGTWWDPNVIHISFLRIQMIF